MKIHLFQCVHFQTVNTNRHWTDLLIITYNDQLFAHIQDCQRRNIGLTGFINDNNIKFVFFGIQTFQSFVDGHDPGGHCGLALAHQLSGFGF